MSRSYCLNCGTLHYTLSGHKMSKCSKCIQLFSDGEKEQLLKDIFKQLEVI